MDKGVKGIKGMDKGIKGIKGTRHGTRCVGVSGGPRSVAPGKRGPRG